MESLRDPKRVGNRFFVALSFREFLQPPWQAAQTVSDEAVEVVGWLVGWLHPMCFLGFPGVGTLKIFSGFRYIFFDGFELFELFCWLVDWLTVAFFLAEMNCKKNHEIMAEFLWFFLVKFSLAKNVDLDSFKRDDFFSHRWPPFLFQKRSFRCTFQTPSYLLIKYRHSGTVWILKGWISRIPRPLQKMGRFFRPHGSARFMHVKKTPMESFVYCMCMNMIYYVYIKIYQVMSVVYRKSWDTVSGTKVLSLKSLKSAQRLIVRGVGCRDILPLHPRNQWDHGLGRKRGNCESWSEDSIRCIFPLEDGGMDVFGRR